MPSYPRTRTYTPLCRPDKSSWVKRNRRFCHIRPRNVEADTSTVANSLRRGQDRITSWIRAIQDLWISRGRMAQNNVPENQPMAVWHADGRMGDSAPPRPANGRLARRPANGHPPRRDFRQWPFGTPSRQWPPRMPREPNEKGHPIGMALNSLSIYTRTTASRRCWPGACHSGRS